MKNSFKKFITFAAVAAATVAGTVKVAADAAKDEEKTDPVAKFVKENIPVDDILKTVGVKSKSPEKEKSEPLKVSEPVKTEKPEPVVEKIKPKVEKPQAKVVPKEEKTAEPISSFITEPNMDDPRTLKIGDAWITDSLNDDCIGIVAAVSGYTPDQLVTLRSEGGVPMVFAFNSPSVRNDVTLEEVFFVTHAGRAILPEDTERDNVIAFGKAFITETPELQEYLQY